MSSNPWQLPLIEIPNSNKMLKKENDWVLILTKDWKVYTWKLKTIYSYSKNIYFKITQECKELFLNA